VVPPPTTAICPFCYGNENKTPPEVLAYRTSGNRDQPGWRVRVVPNKFPVLGIEGELNRQGEGMYDKMNGIGAHEVITTMMFSWIALYLTSWIISGPLKDAAGNSQTPMLPQAVWLPTLDQLLPGIFRVPVRAHLGFIIAIGLAVLVWWILKKTTLGYGVRAVGFNQWAAQNGGISIAITTVYALCISGALAGLAGASEVLGVQHRMFDEVSAGSGFGFTGIAVALLAKNHPIAVIFSAILFGALSAGAGMMQLTANVPDKIIMIVQALIIFFVGAETVITWLIKRRQKLALEREGDSDVA